jgi:hypothetical protein
MRIGPFIALAFLPMLLASPAGLVRAQIGGKSALSDDTEIVNVVTDCGMVGDGVTDNYAAWTSCVGNSRRHEQIYFPPRHGTAQAKYYFKSSGITLTSYNAISSSGSGYKGSVGAIISCAAGLTCITMQGGSTIEHINVYGSEPSSRSALDGYNLIFPSATIIGEYTQSVSSMSLTNQVLQIDFGVQSAWRLNGLIVLSGATGLFARFNGVPMYITGTNEAFGHSYVTVSVPGVANIAKTSVSGVTVGPATTGTSGADGILVEGADVKIDDVFVADFGKDCIEINGSTTISDDPMITRLWTYGCRVHGYYAHGGDSNVGWIAGLKTYFNGLYGVFDTSFLSSIYAAPQASYNYGYGQAVAGHPINISSAARNCSRGICTDTIVTAETLPNVTIGNGVVLAGVSDQSFNTPAVNGIPVTVAGFVSSVMQAAGATTVTFIQGGYGLSNSSSSGGQIYLGSARQIYAGIAIDGGAYRVGGAAHKGAMLDPYDEGGQGIYDPNGCANRFYPGVVLFQQTFGDCTDPAWPASQFTAYGYGAMFVSPHVVQRSNNPSVSMALGVGADYNSVYSTNDILCASGYQNCGNEWRYTEPGQNTSWYGLRAHYTGDEAGMSNYALLLGYGASASAGETTIEGTIGFAGSGLNDATAGGTPTNTASINYLVSVCATGSPDSYQWLAGTAGGVAALTVGSSGGSGYSIGDLGEIPPQAHTGGAEYIITGVSGTAVTSVAVSPGRAGTSFTLSANNATHATQGPIASVTVGAPGANYAVGDTGTISGSLSQPATYQITGVTGSGRLGRVTSIHINFPGKGYAVGTESTLATSGIGTGLSVNISSVSGTGLLLNISSLVGESACTKMAKAGSPNPVTNGVTVTWATNTGHTLRDYWTIPTTATLGGRPPAWIPNDLWLGNATFTKKNVITKVTDSAPTGNRSDGTPYIQGDLAINENPTPTGSFGYVCTNPRSCKYPDDWSQIALSSTVSNLPSVPNAADGWYAKVQAQALSSPYYSVFGSGIAMNGTGAAVNPSYSLPQLTQNRTGTSIGNAAGPVMTTPTYIGRDPVYAAVVYFPNKSDITNVRLWAGFQDEANPTSILNADSIATHSPAMFRFSTVAGDADWMCVSGDGTREKIADSGVAVRSGAIYYLQIKVVRGAITWTINNSALHNCMARSTEVPSISVPLYPTLMTLTEDTNAHNIDWGSVYASAKY